MRIPHKLNYCIYVGFIILAGLQVNHIVISNGKHNDMKNQSISEANLQKPAHVIPGPIQTGSGDNHQSKKMVDQDNSCLHNREYFAQLIRSELEKQFASLDIPLQLNAISQREQRTNEDVAEQANRNGNTDLVNEDEEKKMQSYFAADDLIEDAIVSGQVDAQFAREFLGHLNQLPSEMRFELDRKYAAAINEGHIQPSAPLELMLYEGM